MPPVSLDAGFALLGTRVPVDAHEPRDPFTAHIDAPNEDLDTDRRDAARLTHPPTQL